VAVLYWDQTELDVQAGYDKLQFSTSIWLYFSNYTIQTISLRYYFIEKAVRTQVNKN